MSDLVRLNVETYPGLKGTSRLQDGTVLQLPRAAEAPESSDASPTKLGQGEMAKLAGKAWSERLALRELPNARLEPEICLSSSEELGEEGQAPYVALSEQDRARYQKDMETYVPPAKVRVVTRRKKKAPVRASMPISSKGLLVADGWVACGSHRRRPARRRLRRKPSSRRRRPRIASLSGARVGRYASPGRVLVMHALNDVCLAVQELGPASDEEEEADAEKAPEEEGSPKEKPAKTKRVARYLRQTGPVEEAAESSEEEEGDIQHGAAQPAAPVRNVWA